MASKYLLSRSFKQVFLITVCGTGGFIILSLIPGFPNIFDYRRIIQELDISLYWAPVSFFKLWHGYVFDFIWYADIILMHIILLFGGFCIWKKRDERALLVVIIILLLPVFEFGTGSMGYRLFFNAFCLTFLLLPSLLKKRNIKYIVLLLSVALLPFGSMSYDGTVFDPPADNYKLIADRAVAEIGESDKPVLIIAHKGIKEQILLRSDFDALNWLPDDTGDSIVCYRIVTGIREDEIIRYQGTEQNEWKKLYLNYYLIREKNWNDILKALEEEGEYNRIKELKTWLNPYEKRPRFLR